MSGFGLYREKRDFRLPRENAYHLAVEYLLSFSICIMSFTIPISL
jgi:hypothetical protein